MKKPSMKLITLGVFTAAIVSCVGCSLVTQAHWDHKVDELCEKDGGVTVYEKVEISKSDYPNIKVASNGDVFMPLERMVTGDDPFFIRYTNEVIFKEGNIGVEKKEQFIVRNSDKKVLNKLTSYWRGGGGDLKTGFHPSHHGCKDWPRYLREFNSTITVKGE